MLPVGAEEVWSYTALRAERGCPYEFTKGKHAGGCGHGKAPKGSDNKDGCRLLVDAGECPIQEGVT